MLNTATIQGRLGRDPELRYTNSQTPVCSVSVACDRGGDKGTDWIDVTAFGKTAEFLNKYFKKGSDIIVSGKIRTGSYTGRDGKTVYTFEIVADQIYFCGGKQEQPKQNQPKQAAQVKLEPLDDINDEELPF